MAVAQRFGQLQDELVLTDDEFRALRDLVADRFGIHLTEQKRQLLIGRLRKLLRKYRHRTFQEYYDYVVRDSSGRALSELVDRISTNFTYFFRERDHFDFLRDTILRELIAERRRQRAPDLRIWSAACSTGEEPYTLVMTLLQTLGADYQRWRAGVLATDISAEALAEARRGIYPEERTTRVDAASAKRYLKTLPDGRIAVSDQLKQEVTFRRFNLMNRTFPFKRPFDVIFCRNVMIYFDQDTRDALVQRLYDCTAPGGYLLIGHSETLSRGRSPYRYVLPAVYRREA